MAVFQVQIKYSIAMSDSLTANMMRQNPLNMFLAVIHLRRNQSVPLCLIPSHPGIGPSQRGGLSGASVIPRANPPRDEHR